MIIALVSREGAILDAYRRFFESQGIDLIHMKSISDLFQKLSTTVINGFVVDIQIAIRNTEPEKRWLQTMEGIFPNVRTNWNPETGLRALYRDSSNSETDNLSVFLEDCQKFKPRALRKHVRKNLNFHVLIWPIAAPEEAAERAYTLNISPGGLFACTCFAPPVDSLVWVKIQDLGEQPFKVQVRLTRAWGSGMYIPGFGGSYEGLDGDLAKRLEALL